MVAVKVFKLGKLMSTDLIKYLDCKQIRISGKSGKNYELLNVVKLLHSSSNMDRLRRLKYEYFFYKPKYLISSLELGVMIALPFLLVMFSMTAYLREIPMAGYDH